MAERVERFTFLCNRDERALVAVLAKQLQRSQSDAVRFVVVNAVRELTALESNQGESKTVNTKHQKEEAKNAAPTVQN